MDRVFVVLKGSRRGLPLTAEGLDEILGGPRPGAGPEHATYRQPRHTVLDPVTRGGDVVGGGASTSSCSTPHTAGSRIKAEYDPDNIFHPRRQHPPG